METHWHTLKTNSLHAFVCCLCLSPGLGATAAELTGSGTDKADDKATFTVGRLQVQATAQTIFVSLGGEPLFELPARVAVDTTGASDQDLFEPAFTKEDGGCIWTVRSSNWEKKQYSLSVEGQAVVLRTKVQGRGRLEKLRFFPEGRTTARQLQYEVSRYLLPVALGGADAAPQWRNTMQSASIELGYLTPPLLAFPFVGEFAGSCAFGLAPGTGEYNLDHFRCNFGSYQTGLFSTDFVGYTEVTGEYELPALTLVAEKDEMSALAAYAQWLYRCGGCRQIDRSSVPRWWLGPFFCGFGEQGHLSPNNIYDGANQKDYTAMSDRMDELGLEPSAIIIDDKWQTQYGENLPDPKKWPDLRAYVDSEHAKGRRVLLWLKFWDNEGLGSEESIHCLCTPYGADPTSPAYQRRVKETVRRLLSSDPGCFDCDGFKIDFANCMPLGKNLATHEPGVYGIELLKRMMTLFYTAAKVVKPDCLINNSCDHPYFSEVTDQCRLHDCYWKLRIYWEVREHRAKLFQAAFPGISVDTDNGVSSSRRQTLEYLRRSPELGIPVLYHLHGTANLPLTDDDFKEVAEMWRGYSRKLDAGK